MLAEEVVRPAQPIRRSAEAQQIEDGGRMAQQFKAGDIVTVKQNGALVIGGMTLTDNVFGGVPIVARNPDGSYQVDLRRVISAPGMESVRVPAEWVSSS
jgi:ribosomal protein L21E